MKDLIAKLQMDATCAMGAIWMHIDAQAARIAELEAQIAAKTDTDKLREAIFMAGIPTMAINGMNNFSSWESECWARGALAMRVAVLELMNDTALQAPVREVPDDWISISARLPSEDCRVLAATWFDMTQVQQVEVVSFRAGSGTFSDCNVTHWAPLPAAPVQTEGGE